MLAKPGGRLKLGEAVAIVRSARGWTQDQLAKASQTSLGTINRIESGDQSPRRRTVYRIAKALRISPELLLDERASEAELLAAMRVPSMGNRPKSPASRAAPKTLLPLRSLPVLRREDLEGIRLREGARQESDRWLPARSEDPNAFFLLAEGNFGRIHQTLRVTPAMEAGIANHVWSIEEIVGLLDRPVDEIQPAA